MPSKLDRLLEEFDALQNHGCPPEEYDALIQKCYRNIVVALREAQMYVALDAQGQPVMRFDLEDKALLRKMQDDGVPVVKAVVVVP